MPGIFHLLFVLVLGLSGQAQASLGQFFQSESRFLPVEKAFVFDSAPTSEGLLLQWHIEPGYYLYQNKIQVETSATDATLAPLRFNSQAEQKDDPSFGMVDVFHNRIEATQAISANTTAPIELTLTYQGCAEAGLCYPPQRQTLFFTPSAQAATAGLPLPLQSADPATDLPRTTTNTVNTENASSVFDFIRTGDLATICGIFFLIGIGLTFTPCVFPMIPILSSVIAGQRHITHAHAFFLSLAYVLGMALTYSLAGVITGLAGASANMQALLQTPPVLITFALAFVALSLSMFGFYELQLPAFARDRLNNASHRMSGGKFASVTLLGAISALIVSPCVSAPMAGALVYISTTGDALIGGLSLFSMGLGMGVPLLLIGSGGHKFLPKAGHWMNEVKIFFGVALLGVAIWLVERLISPSTSLLLWALLTGSYAMHLGAFEPAKPGLERLKKAAAFFLALYAAMLFAGAMSGASDAFAPLASFTQASQNPPEKNSGAAYTEPRLVYSIADLDDALDLAARSGQTLVADIYADWCVSCKVIEKQVFRDPVVQQRLGNSLLVKVDITRNDADNLALLTRYGLFGPPAILFFNNTGEELSQHRLVGEVTQPEFLRTLSAVQESL